MIQNNLSLRIIDSSTFKDMLPQQYEAVCSKTFKDKVIMSLYQSTRDEVLKILSEEAKVYAESSDQWTSNAQDPFTHVSIHFYK